MTDTDPATRRAPSLRRRNQIQERRRHRRVRWTAAVRGLGADGAEFTAATIDICAGGLRISVARALAIGETVVLYLEEIGRVEGVVARMLREGDYAIALNIPSRKREKIADQLTWLINRDALGLTEEREGERRPAIGQVIASYAGVSIACAVSDVSIFGVALRTTGPRPMIGDRIAVGERLGTCVRYIDGGFAVDFRAMASSDAD
ncbi:MAG: PilZ domain-containing protein [Alphaproteobacteria bacterium]|nr:PilZ domain-containing protein [Alphaproteobacteria bacterium]